ncbi:hypothetical protein [Citrobacter freundii]|uniref:hypothetical protein n=1 Tax=Citrobacter freundii TaxID=546 RepID=UPI00254E5DE5|nr:hypothetical protein [Citrobacter freundii]MDK6378379.1 hypothetical protein [Citrobacter freundii]
MGFHNCLNRGSYDEIRQGVPFLSRSGPNQWLTQGYYFWTDDPHWAYKWNESRPSVISEFTITFESKEELLDLVGNTQDILQFEEMRKQVVSTLTRMSALHVTVNQVISFFRELEERADLKGVFPYSAVKAQDNARSSSLIRLNFIDGHFEQLVSFTRQQMCVYEHAKHKIEFQRFLAPAEFCGRV